MRFDLYLESGPQHKRTWIYVPALPGCSAVSATSAEAPQVAADAIRTRLDFLRRHGEPVADAEPLELTVAEHVIERQVLGFGQQFFETDFAPLTADEAARLLRWAGWSREELVAAARAQTIPLLEKPESGGRSAAAILSHAASSEWAYVSGTLGTLRGGSAAIAAIEAAGEEPWDALAAEREVVAGRLANLTPEELERVVEKHGVPHWTARRMFRRMLEHEWEHVQELRARL
jgi:predicted RNase H-like HicB family nuclease